MNVNSNRYRWFIVGTFFIFMLLHQSDKLLIGPLTSQIMETYQIDEVEMGAVFTGALIVGAILYPIWGTLYDRFSRPKLLSAAALLWGSTTWISAIAPTYKSFLASRASTGIDDSSYPGLYSLISDYFEPQLRGKIYGFLQLSQPIGYLVGILAATLLSGLLGWRGVFYITGSLGIILAIIIYIGVKDAPRGNAEPELSGVDVAGKYRFDKEKALALFKKKTLVLLFIQGFVGVFPWNVITYWFFRYLETERGYSSNEVLFTMAPAVIVLASGYFIGGSIGDYYYKKTPRGRILVSMFGVIIGAILFAITLSIPVERKMLFLISLLGTAVFIPFASPNVISSVYDVTVPEVRSTALSIQYFIENGGAALAPLLAGFIAKYSSLHTAILLICISTWVIGAFFLGITAKYIPDDIKSLRAELKHRAIS